jgi:Transglycosylase SLT domain
MSDEVCMSQFRTLPSFQSSFEEEMIEEQIQSIKPPNPVHTVTRPTSPLIFFTGPLPTTPTSELLSRDSGQQPIVTTEQLAAISGASLSTTPSTGRLVRIPGARSLTEKSAVRITEELTDATATKHISPRIRHGIILTAILLVAVTTLVTLSPLDSEQSPLHIFKNLSQWAQSQQVFWLFQSHVTLQPTPQPVAQQPQQPAPPPMVLPTSAYVAMAQQDAINAGISPTYFARQINLESGYNPNAVSPSGAEGIAQFMPGTAAGLGINPFDPVQALNAAAHLMASYNKNYGGNYAMALAAYNGGSGTVQYAINACGSANWMNCLPGQTRNYIRVIMGI